MLLPLPFVVCILMDCAVLAYLFSPAVVSDGVPECFRTNINMNGDVKRVIIFEQADRDAVTEPDMVGVEPRAGEPQTLQKLVPCPYASLLSYTHDLLRHSAPGEAGTLAAREPGRRCPPPSRRSITTV
jgi:hypothetical protein